MVGAFLCAVVELTVFLVPEWVFLQVFQLHPTVQRHVGVFGDSEMVKLAPATY